MKESISYIMGNRKINNLILCCILPFVFTGCALLQETEQNQINLVSESAGIDYNLAQVEKGDVTLSRKIYATYKEESGEELSFGTDGRRVEEVYFKTGDAVNAGDLIAKLECSDLEAEKASYEYIISKNRQLKQNANELRDFDLADIKKAYEKGWYDYDRYLMNVNELNKSVNEQIEDYDDAIAVASIKLDEVNEKIAGCHIYAGMDGSVSYISTSITNGENKYQTGETVIRVIDKSHCVFIVDMEDVRGYLSYISPGQIAVLHNSASASVETEVMPFTEEDETIILELVELDESLKIGTKLFLNLDLDEAKNVLYLPAAAVHKTDDNYYVYVADEGGLKSMKYITVGLIGDQYTEIKSGLQEGDIVIK